MLNQQQRDTFRLALAAHNRYTIESVDDLDIDDIISDDQIIETRETIEDFFNARGWRNDRNGNRPDVPRELNKTIVGDLYIWEDQQSRKGARRGTLFVMDFGDARACYFDGES